MKSSYIKIHFQYNRLGNAINRLLEKKLHWLFPILLLDKILFCFVIFEDWDTYIEIDFDILSLINKGTCNNHRVT